MPLKIRHLPNSNKVRVYYGKRIIARRTTMGKARKQANLIRGIKHGWKPTGRR